MTTPAEPPPTPEDRARQHFHPPFRFVNGYIWDADGEMVADDHVIGESPPQPDAVLRVRGWGRMKYEKESETLYESVGKAIAEALTRGWAAGPADDERKALEDKLVAAEAWGLELNAKVAELEARAEAMKGAYELEASISAKWKERVAELERDRAEAAKALKDAAASLRDADALIRSEVEDADLGGPGYRRQARAIDAIVARLTAEETPAAMPPNCDDIGERHKWPEGRDQADPQPGDQCSKCERLWEQVLAEERTTTPAAPAVPVPCPTPDQCDEEGCQRACETEQPPDPAGPAVPACEPGCGRSGGHPGGDDTYLCSPACEALGHPVNPLPKETGR